MAGHLSDLEGADSLMPDSGLARWWRIAARVRNNEVRLMSLDTAIVDPRRQWGKVGKLGDRPWCSVGQRAPEKCATLRSIPRATGMCV